MLFCEVYGNHYENMTVEEMVISACCSGSNTYEEIEALTGVPASWAAMVLTRNNPENISEIAA